jgi:hypothetical protein
MQATPASEWRKPREEGYLVELPSGRMARLGQVDLSSLLLKGDIPDFLTPTVSELLFGTVTEEQFNEDFSPEQMLARGKGYLEFINAICKASFIEPRIANGSPGEGEIAIEDVPLDDRSFVFSIAIHGVEVLRSFRVGQEEAVEPVRDSEDEPDEAKCAPGD